MRFKGKKVIVTGASKSIGREIALSYAKEGADVVISYCHDSKGAAETLSQLCNYGSNALALQADFSEQQQVAAFYEAALAHLASVDILINNAARLSRETLFDLSPESMQKVFQVNTLAPLYLLQLCSQQMKENACCGSIVNISSIAGNMTVPRGIAYAASKAAINKLTQNAALNLAEYGIRVNAVAPGVIEAGMNQETYKSNPVLWQTYLAKIPLKRTGTPVDIANMVVFLTSEQAEWVTGKTFEVDGGHVL